MLTMHRVFSSGQSLNFLGLMQRVRPMHEVRKLRHSVAVQKIKDISRKMVLVRITGISFIRYLILCLIFRNLFPF